MSRKIDAIRREQAAIFINPRKLFSVMPYNQRSPWPMDIQDPVTDGLGDSQNSLYE
jgi:hypothetical protein